MLAKELKAGDQYRDENGTVQITVVLAAEPELPNPVSGVPQVGVGVKFRDGGHSRRWFDADAEVPYTRPEGDS